jgi:SCP-2 sterol transfer family.
MATVDECRAAMEELAARLLAHPEEARRITLDRSFTCHIRDLDVSFHGRLSQGRLVDVGDGDDPRADIRLVVTSDDLVALVAGELNVAKAWASGRLSIHASFRDLLKLRSLL